MSESKRDKSAELGESFRQSRRELWVMLGSWTVFLAWTLGYCGTHAFADPNGGEVPLLFGMPRWVFVGIALPWLAANGFIVWFAMGFMKDTPLEDETSPESETSTASNEVVS